MTQWPGFSSSDGAELNIRLNTYDFWYISRHTSAASSSHQTGTSALDASCSHLTDTYLFSFKRISDRKNIISWSPGNLMVSASPAHHIRGIWAKVLRYIWKDKQVNTPRFRLKIVTSSNVLACSLMLSLVSFTAQKLSRQVLFFTKLFSRVTKL